MHKIKSQSLNLSFRGFTLIELLACLAILAIYSTLQLNTAVHVISSIQARAELNTLETFLKNSRKYALLNKQNIHLCSLVENQCKVSLGSNLSSFIDLNRDKTLNPDSEEIILQHNFQSSYSSLHSNNLDFININYLGMNNYLGSLYYCFVKGDYIFSKKISASMQGRYKVYNTDISVCQ